MQRGRLGALVLAFVIAIVPSFADAGVTCPADERAFFLKALDKIRPLSLTMERIIKPEQMTYELLLPEYIVDRYFNGFSSPEAFHAANPDCCSLHHDLTGFGDITFDPGFFSLLLGAPDIRSKDVVVVHIDIRVEADVAGRVRRFKKFYEVLLDRCAGDLNVGRFDISRSGPIEERRPGSK